MSCRRICRWRLLALLAGVFSSTLCAQETDTAKLFAAIQHEVQTLFEKCRGAVVRIEAVDDHGSLSGTGFFIDPNGTLYTSYTVGGESREIRVHFGKGTHPATRLIADRRTGLAILKINAETPFLPFGRSRDLSLASAVMTIGHPMDLPPTPTFGLVGGFTLKYRGRYFATSHIRPNLAVQSGEGGAPLLNMRGEAVGIVISSFAHGSGSFVLPIEAAEKVRKDFVRFGEVRPGWLGIQVAGLAPPVSGSSARIEALIEDGPGMKAGLKPGDVLLRVGEREIHSPEDVLDASFYLTAEDELSIAVARGDAPLELRVQPCGVPGSGRALTPPLGAPADLAIPPVKIDK